LARSSGRWLRRVAAVGAGAAVILLLVLVEPLPEFRGALPTPTASATRSPTSTAVPTSTPTPSATPTPIPTQTPLPPGHLQEGTYWSETTGKEERYLVYLPPGYESSERRYPVLYLLHGWPYDEYHWKELGADAAADEGIRAGSFPPFIAVLPGADPDGLYVNSSGGEGSFEAQLVADLIPHVDGTYRTWNAREGRAIGGISRGGVWSLEIGFRRSDLFSAVGGHSVALEVNRAPPEYDPFFLIDEEGVRSVRIYLDAGDGDWALAATRQLHQDLLERGIDHAYVVHQGEHADPLWQENVAEYLQFYSAQWPADWSGP
jgi:enterochelin esterase-like enzyme